MRELSDYSVNIRWFYHLKELVRSVVLQATDSRRGIEEREALLLAERHDFVDLEMFVWHIHEMVLVTKEYLSLNAPVVIDKVGIIKVHAPSLALGRKTTQKQHLGVLRQERLKRVVLYPIPAAGYILCILFR